MSDTSQKRALHNYRKRLNQRGMARFEVLGLDADRELIRSLARRLAGNGPDSAQIRATVRRTVSGEPPKKGGILNALRRSPLVGADLNLKRPVDGWPQGGPVSRTFSTPISSAMSPNRRLRPRSSHGWLNKPTRICSSLL